jgi:methylated-DNA-[protein]-cysteine S-methyltransferase
MIYKGLFISPIGNILIQTNETALLSLTFSEDAKEEHLEENYSIVLEKVKNQLHLYFEKKLSKFDLPTSIHLTEFQNSVLNEVKKISYGTVISYAQLAHRMGSSRLTRAVASANAANPILIVIPCHRVVGKNGSMTGYSGAPWRKEWLLKHEQNYPDLGL